MRKQLAKSEIKELNERLEKQFSKSWMTKKDKVIIDDNDLYINEKLHFVKIDDDYVPTLKLLLTDLFLKTVTVDMGAVRFMIKGADVMRPGITDITDDIKTGDIIAIIDENNKKPITVGKALFDASEMKAATSGKVIKNLHYIGDEIWNK